LDNLFNRLFNTRSGAVEMAVITIKDTGKRYVGGADPGEDKANGGNLITIPGVTLSYGLDAGVDDAPEVNKKEDSNNPLKMYDYPVVDKMGVSAPSWTVGGVIDSRETVFDPTNDQYGLALFGILNSLVRTKGYKELTGDLPSYSNEGVSDTTVNCRVRSLAIQNESVNNIIKWTLSLVETR